MWVGEEGAMSRFLEARGDYSAPSHRQNKAYNREGCRTSQNTGTDKSNVGCVHNYVVGRKRRTAGSKEDLVRDVASFVGAVGRAASTFWNEHMSEAVKRALSRAQLLLSFQPPLPFMPS